MPLKIFTDDGSASTFQVAAALRYAADMGADVANLSISSPFASDTMAAGVNYALARDVVVVAAAGNSNAGTPRKRDRLVGPVSQPVWAKAVNNARRWRMR